MIKEGDYVRIKDMSHWDVTSVNEPVRKTQVDGVNFVSRLENGMKQYIGKVICVEFITKDYTYFVSRDYAWDTHCIEELLAKETNPEYFL